MILYNLLSLILIVSCQPVEDNNPTNIPAITVTISTDKATYKPGDKITFYIDKSLPPSTMVRYRHYNDIIKENLLTGQTWNWIAPSDDYTGYMADIYNLVNGTQHVYCSIGIDVSSDWSKFPRYGFLSKFPQLTDESMTGIINNLTRYHINGLLFYDFENKHHKPLAGTPENPESSWPDIAKRTIYLSTVQSYITKAHEHNMMAMFYNLAYGAWKDAFSDGVSDKWYMYTNLSHTSKDYIYLPDSWSSSIYLLNPSDREWQDYISKQNEDLYKVFDFDGYHVDQLGNRDKNLYTYNGALIDLSNTFTPFLNAIKVKTPGKRLLMNAVDQYGQQGIAKTDVDFLYTEVWSPTTYDELADVITDNNAFCNSKMNTVLAAYMNRGLSDVTGYFNLPGVLLTESVIFAFGGSHIELGEHMLVHEYFPNSNRMMSVDLQKAMIAYYDFLVAYENLLRDGGTFNSPSVTSIDRQMNINNWPPRSGNVAVLGKEVGGRQVIHLINFSTSADLNWRDDNGTRRIPVKYQNSAINANVSGKVRKVWYASPDYNHGSSTELSFTQAGNSITFKIPYLQYWGMIVVE